MGWRHESVLREVDNWNWLRAHGLQCLSFYNVIGVPHKTIGSTTQLASMHDVLKVTLCDRNIDGDQTQFGRMSISKIFMNAIILPDNIFRKHKLNM